ncbi:MAG: hypothetical protein ACREAN_08690, partial [Nitrosopumilaceae archaeon]
MSASTVLSNEKSMSKEKERESVSRIEETNQVLSSLAHLNSRYEILVPLTGESDSKTKEQLRYAASLARQYSMKVVLVQAIPDLLVPEGYVTYARVEGIADYHYRYLESVKTEE